MGMANLHFSHPHHCYLLLLLNVELYTFDAYLLEELYAIVRAVWVGIYNALDACLDD